MALIAYARVSTEGQTLEAQVAQLKAASAEKVFKEKISGARADRPQLRKAIAALEPKDVLLVTRLDRFGPFDPRSPERAGRDCQEGRRLPITE
jgi:DNA invertase Pin-like site-specific DNA recombinase